MRPNFHVSSILKARAEGGSTLHAVARESKDTGEYTGMPNGAGNGMGSPGRETDTAIAVLSGTRVKIENANGIASSMQGEECRQPGRYWQRQCNTPSCERPISKHALLMSTWMVMLMLTITSGRMHVGGAWCSCLVVCSFVVLRAVRVLRVFGCCRLLRFFGDVGTAAVLAYFGGVLLLLLPTVDAGQCAFTQVGLGINEGTLMVVSRESSKMVLAPTDTRDFLWL